MQFDELGNHHLIMKSISSCLKKENADISIIRKLDNEVVLTKAVVQAEIFSIRLQKKTNLNSSC